MEFLNDLVLAASMVERLTSIVGVALGLGLVIFFHELGHFAVAKWCNVQVERFSIGFGPILWSWKWGETEYALSAIPFGGYVKMLGQDDLDPSQLSSEDIARNPRSYSSKTVPQRMAIISAGVIMNVLTAMIFFGVAFGIGIEQEPPDVGFVLVGKPAWVAALRSGDRITAINGREVETFGDVNRATALSTGALDIEYVRPDGSTAEVTVHPDRSGSRPQIGVASTSSLTVAEPKKTTLLSFFAVPGTPAASTEPALQAGDQIVAVDDVDVKTWAQFHDVLARRRGETLKLKVARNDGPLPVELTVAPNPFRTLGLWMDIGKIAAVQNDSPAARAGLQVEDKITAVNGQEVGRDVNPLDLPDLFWDSHGKEVALTVVRTTPDGPKTIQATLVPEDRPGWIEEPLAREHPLSIPSIGVAFHIGRTIRKVEPGSPADEAKIVPNDRIVEVQLIRPKEAPPDKDKFTDEVVRIPFVAPDKQEPWKETNWAYAWWQIQETPERTVKLTVTDEKGNNAREVPLTPRIDSGRYSPDRGFVLAPRRMTIKADGFANAVALGFVHTRNTIVDIYLSLRSLLTGRVSPTEMQGPIKIAQIAYIAAKEGFAELMLFLGILSVNLAVINFLPIPVLDGGHMVFLIWEGVTRRKPSERVLIAAQYFGMAFVLALMLAVLYLDLFVHTR